MDDILMGRLLLMTKILNPMLLKELIDDLPDPSCDLCNKIPRNRELIKCIFCDKCFCFFCCGKENTRICSGCNHMIATNVNEQILKQFSVKELRVLTDNYNVSLKNINEKDQLIDAILTSFKKSIKGNNEQIVNVSELKEKMEYLKEEESRDKERILLKEKNQSKLFSDYSNVHNETKELSINFRTIDIDSIDILEQDIPNLTIKKLKEFLNRFEIDYFGIVEKKELVSLALNLHHTFTKFKERQNRDEDTKIINKDLECSICMNNFISCVFIDCGHSMCCFECGFKLSKCPICRKEVKQCFKIVIG